MCGLQLALLGPKRAYDGGLGDWWRYQLHKHERLARHAGSDVLAPESRVIEARGAGAAREDWADEVRTTLEREPPELVLSSTQLSTLARATRSDAEYLPEVRELVAERYRPVARFGRIVVHRRIGSSPPD